MNQDTLNIAITQLSDPGIIGLLCIFAAPIIFGAITAYYSYKSTDKVTKEWWSKYK